MSDWGVEEADAVSEQLKKEAQAKSDLRQVPSSPTQLCVIAEIGVPSLDHGTLIIELKLVAASHIPCMMLSSVQRTPATFAR